MSNNSLPAPVLSHEEASALDEHLLKSTHHLIDLKWAILKQWEADTYKTTHVQKHLFAARDALNEACNVLESAQLRATTR